MGALHPDAVFESPVMHMPQHGREITFKYLVSAEEVLGGPGFIFVNEWRSENGVVLEFENEIDGILINGVDIITLDEENSITHFKVMARPLKADGLSPGALVFESPGSRMPLRGLREGPPT